MQGGRSLSHDIRMVGRFDAGLADDAACGPDNDDSTHRLADRAGLLHQKPSFLFAGVRAAMEFCVAERQSGDRVFGADEECV